MMDQQQTQQTEQMIAQMLAFLETSSEDEHELDPQAKGTCNGADNPIKTDLNDNFIIENRKNYMKPLKELAKLRQLSLSDSNEMGPDSKNDPTEAETLFSSKFDNLEWQFKLENHCRRSYNNVYTQEVYKAVYQNTNGHPRSASADYYQAAQNYVFYGKHFLDFPKNMQVLLNDKIGRNSAAESSSLMPSFSSGLCSKPNTITPNAAITGNGGPSTAAYYQILNNMQAQSRSGLAQTPVNSTAYGIFLGNKVTYVAGTPTTPSLIYNQHSTAATNFISNSLANAALATSPNLLYANPLLTATTQQYLTQFLSAAALTSNSIQATTVSANAAGGSVYERLIYAQMLQQQLYQTQQAASIAGVFQTKARVVNQAARQAANVINANSNRASPQPLTSAPLSCSSNGLTFTGCYRQAQSTSPRELALLKPQPSVVAAPAATCDNSQVASA